ncbi:MAG: hypothetical protein M1816_005358 [Peltula sp. TS41687]|nr:MAG: hypothetical protein M1816_005358 [Peltula sp. TS41687]
MDPLSIMASVAGLLTATAKVSSVLRTVTTLKDAPKLARSVLVEVDQIRSALNILQDFIRGIDSQPRSRRALIQLEDLIAMLTELVLTFSELEATVTGLDSSDPWAWPGRVKWAWKEDTILQALERIQRQKSSLSLMMNIIQCQSDRQAEESQESLHSLVEEVFRSNKDLSQRLRNLEETYSTRRSIQQGVKDKDRRNEGDYDQDDADTIVPDKGTKPHPEPSLIQMAAFHFAFEDELYSSRVYRRTQLNTTDVSFTSSAVRTNAWSVFSGLSLADVSVISAFALPIYLHEISNRQHYIFGEPGLTALNSNPDKPQPLYPWSRRRFVTDHLNPFPCYGAAVNPIVSKEGNIRDAGLKN